MRLGSHPDEPRVRWFGRLLLEEGQGHQPSDPGVWLGSRPLVIGAAVAGPFQEEGLHRLYRTPASLPPSGIKRMVRDSPVRGKASMSCGWSSRSSRVEGEGWSCERHGCTQECFS